MQAKTVGAGGGDSSSVARASVSQAKVLDGGVAGSSVAQPWSGQAKTVGAGGCDGSSVAQ